MDLIFSASIIASFVAGMAALFAPCCITVLLPTYLASVFRAKKAILKMTFIFLAGRGLTIMPMPKMPAFTGNSKSIFLLGIFSGAATSCCAPVLAGAITLAALTASFWKALVVTFAYVFGMTLPLFIAAYFYDRFNISQSKFISGKMFKIEIAKKKIYIHSTNLIAGIIFL